MVRIDASVDHGGSAPERTESSSLRKHHASGSIINPANRQSTISPLPSPRNLYKNRSGRIQKIRKSQIESRMTTDASKSEPQNTTISE
jgi:hypothetical protein